MEVEPQAAQNPLLPNEELAGVGIESPAPQQGEGSATQPAAMAPQALSPADQQTLKTKLRMVAMMLTPAIYKRGTGESDFLENMGIRVQDWSSVRQGRGYAIKQIFTSHQGNRSGRGVRHDGTSHRPSVPISHGLNPAPKLSRALKSKANGQGRQYTSKFRGVHQTFPTRRWEAQFRRNGKPTSLGCFDHEEEAARAYDKMMLWCELHNAAGIKGGITNYDPQEYELDIPYLQNISQDDLIDHLRTNGRKQAAQRQMKHKRTASATPVGGGHGHNTRRSSREGTADREYSGDLGTTIGGRRTSSYGDGSQVDGASLEDPEMQSANPFMES